MMQKIMLPSSGLDVISYRVGGGMGDGGVGLLAFVAFYSGDQTALQIRDGGDPL